jgi:tRNA 2-thiocytidine biosynthesis protein TtcA
MSSLENKLLTKVAKASADFSLLEDGDKVMVGLSGGKDSYALLHLLRIVEKKAPFSFSIVAVNLDQGHPGFPQNILVDYLESEGHQYRMLSQDTYSIVKEKIPVGKTYCSLCSRLRRGILYNAAEEMGATKIALGHHRDDMVETLMLNLFFAGQLQTMPPRLVSDDGRNIVIRPLAYCAEADIANYATEKAFPIIPCDLCGSQENLQRQRIKSLLNQLQKEAPHIRNSIFAAMTNVRPSHLLDPVLQAAWTAWNAEDEETDFDMEAIASSFLAS